ncbi:MAG: YjcG family protein [Bacillaceae bacterium]
MKYWVMIFPSKKIQDLANSYRKRYDSSYAYIPPHVTLKKNFTVEDEAQLEKYVQEFQRIASEGEPFILKTTKVSSFYPASNTLYFKVEPNVELQVLYDKLHSGIFEAEKHHAFVPHITIAKHLSDQEHGDVYSQLRMKDFHYEEWVDRFHLLYELENGTWTVYETFRLGQKC